MPAGMEMTVRTIGTKRASATAGNPQRSKNRIAASTSRSSSSGTRRTSAVVRRSPSARPTAYTPSPPSTDPAVVQAIGTSTCCPFAAALTPARGSSTSPGTGGNSASAAITSMVPGPPSSSIRARAHAVTSMSRLPPVAPAVAGTVAGADGGQVNGVATGCADVQFPHDKHARPR